MKGVIIFMESKNSTVLSIIAFVFVAGILFFSGIMENPDISPLFKLTPPILILIAKMVIDNKNKTKKRT